jgi:ABC-type Fe3+/spermidine/putrescine transport system ATPase subunit
MSDRVAVMNEGVLEQVGAPEDVYRRPASLFTAQFVGLANTFQGHIRGRAGAIYQVDLDGGRIVPAYGPDDVADGSAVSLIVRPENVRLGDVTAQGAPAEVASVSYLGPSRSVRLEAADLGPIVASVPGNGRPLAEGDRVTVSFEAADAWIVT